MTILENRGMMVVKSGFFKFLCVKCHSFWEEVGSMKHFDFKNIDFENIKSKCSSCGDEIESYDFELLKKI